MSRAAGDDSIGARVAEKNKAIREALRSELGVSGESSSPSVEDTLIDDAVGEAIDAAGFDSLSEADLAGGRRQRGGGAASKAFRDLVDRFQSKMTQLMRRTDEDTGRALQVIASGGGELAAASSALGRATTLATFTAMIAAALPTLAEYTPSPSWTQVGEVVVAFARNAIVEIPKGLVLGAAQNPVLALAMGTALMKWRAKSAGKSIRALLLADAAALGAAIGRRTTGPGALGEIARRVQTTGPRVAFPDPTLQSAQTPGGIATGETTLVPGSRVAADPGAPIRTLARTRIPTVEGTMRGVKRTLGFEDERPPAALPANDEPLVAAPSSSSAGPSPRERRSSKTKKQGGTVSSKRRTTQGRPIRRRGTRRKAGMRC